MKKYVCALSLLCLLITSAYASGTQTTYFSCKVKEPTDGTKKVIVTVKFAVENLDVRNEQGWLVQYPGSTEEDKEYGTIMVRPIMYGRNQRYTMMSNLNGQG